MDPEPVATVSSTCPFTVNVRSNVASVIASAGIAARARTAVARRRCFIVLLIS